MKNRAKAYQFGLKICMLYMKKKTERRLKTSISAISYTDVYSNNGINNIERTLLHSINNDMEIKKFEKVVNRICRIYPREGRVLKLRYIEDYEMQDIINCMNISKSTCYRLRRKAVEELGLIYLKDLNEKER